MSLPAALLILGVALCLVSTVLAVIQLLRLEPPRLAVLALVAGILALFAGTQMQPGAFAPGDVAAAIRQAFTPDTD